jgi:hypothetical protein
VNLRDFGQPWIPAGERSGLLTRIAASDDLGTVAAKMTSPQDEVREKCTTNEK